MSDDNTTRITLLLRIRDPGDQEAWSRFVDLYSPVVYRFAVRKGLQDADAADITQDVMRTVARSIGSFHYDPDRGSFRSWLRAVTLSRVNDYFNRRNRQPLASGGDSNQLAIDNHPAPPDDSWDREYEHRLFELACEKVRPQFEDSTWLAFWKTSVEGTSPAEVAASLSLSTGAVYIAKSRVTMQLRSQIDRLVQEIG